MAVLELTRAPSTVTSDSFDFSEFQTATIGTERSLIGPPPGMEVKEVRNDLPIGPPPGFRVSGIRSDLPIGPPKGMEVIEAKKGLPIGPVDFDAESMSVPFPQFSVRDAGD